ncbi:hypothetical protein [Streptomyces sp. NPDC059063]|uniref:hypothetical protein n=1 Tax=unclassified Streptomyces TaxID=2593676 RepID=UPI00369E8F77
MTSTEHLASPTTVDPDDVLRARTLLLASGRRTPHEEVDAYRILSRVTPAAYLPRLSEALVRLSHERGYQDHHAARLAVLEEAVAAARAVDTAEPQRAELLHRALDGCQRQLYVLGRRAEGLAVRAEMVAVGRAQGEASGDPEDTVRGLPVWAAGLSEEGRHAEAADAMTEWVTASRPGGSRSGALAWYLLQWIAALDAAGRTDEALAACAELVRGEAHDAAADRGPMACHFYALIEYARMLDAHGRHGDEAAAARHEALVLLTELAATGERTSWSGYQSTYWAVVFTLSSARSERQRAPLPHPPFGAGRHHWSHAVQERYVDRRAELQEEADALARRADDAPDAMAELIEVHRLLTVRSAVRWEQCSHCCPHDEVRPLFDEGIRLARRLTAHDPSGGTAALVAALMDRATFRTAAKEFGAALDDLQEALRVLGEPDRCEPA